MFMEKEQLWKSSLHVCLSSPVLGLLRLSRIDISPEHFVFTRRLYTRGGQCLFIWEPNKCRRPESFARYILGSKAVKNYHVPTLTQSLSLWTPWRHTDDSRQLRAPATASRGKTHGTHLLGQEFSFLWEVQTDSGAHPVSVQWVEIALSLGVKRPGRDADHSSPSSAEIKNEHSYTSSSSTCLHAVYMCTFTMSPIEKYDRWAHPPPPE
jgi:hypothetical protein